MAGLAAELEDQNVINEGYSSSAVCNALFVSACPPPGKVTRLVYDHQPELTITW